MREIKDRGATSDDYAPMKERSRQLKGLKVGEVVCVHINSKHILCVYIPDPGCIGCVLNVDGVACSKWVGLAENCRLVPLEDAVE